MLICGSRKPMVWTSPLLIQTVIYYNHASNSYFKSSTFTWIVHIHFHIIYWYIHRALIIYQVGFIETVNQLDYQTVHRVFSACIFLRHIYPRSSSHASIKLYSWLRSQPTKYICNSNPWQYPLIKSRSWKIVHQVQKYLGEFKAAV